MTRVLVAYASKHGSTAEIAEAIAEELRRHGVEADRLEAGGVRHLESYSAVVLGSAVYMKRWQGSARRFLRRHRGELESMPFWVFSSGPVGEPKPEDPQTAEWLEPSKVIAEVEGLGAREHVVFGGRVPADPHNFVERAMTKNTQPEFADRRNWNEITSWAAGIAAQLKRGSGVSAAA